MDVRLGKAWRRARIATIGLLSTMMLAAGLAVGLSARADVVVVATPTVEGPITGGVHGHALFDSWFDLAPFGYTQSEYFVSGNAASSTGAIPAAYKTRIMVSRPVDPARFNGTVLLDCVNVTAQFENAVDTVEASQSLLREGFAIVWVSAQSAGLCCTPLTPQVWDPVRYGSLHHPGDDYAADMFSQIAKAMRTRLGVDPLGGLQTQRVLAAGQSQSASKLYSYVNTVQNTTGLIDGFLIHGGGQKTFSVPLSVPVLNLLSDREAKNDQPTADPNYRLWEVAGTAHSDFWIGYQSEAGQGPRTLADRPPASKADMDAILQTAGNYGEQVHPLDAVCIAAGATMPMHYATSTAMHDLSEWVRTGTAPANGPRFEFNADGTLAVDQYQNTLGGIRLPPIDVRVATYVTNPCQLGGITVPFTEAQLRLLYPTFADYFSKMQAATAASLAGGWLLPEDAADLQQRACAAKIRWQDLSATPC
jgi:hypothetical protein